MRSAPSFTLFGPIAANTGRLITGIGDGDRHHFTVGKDAVGGDEGDIVDTRLREIGSEMEGTGAVTVISERGISRDTPQRLESELCHQGR